MKFSALSAALATGLALSGCAVPAPLPALDTPGAQALLAMPLPEYGARIRLARQIAADCGRYAYNDQMQVAVGAARPDTAGGSLEALRQRGGIDVATDVATRSFQARHRVTVGASDLCAAGDAEFAEGSPIGVLLVQARRPGG